jgi:hypothetical protein
VTCTRLKARLQGHGGKCRAGHEGVDSKMKDASTSRRRRGREDGRWAGCAEEIDRGAGRPAGGGRETRNTAALGGQEAVRRKTRGEVTENLWEIRTKMHLSRTKISH